jgi:hypothetical protein
MTLGVRVCGPVFGVLVHLVSVFVFYSVYLCTSVYQYAYVCTGEWLWAIHRYVLKKCSNPTGTLVHRYTAFVFNKSAYQCVPVGG